MHDCEAEIKGEGCEVALHTLLVVCAHCKLAYHKWCKRTWDVRRDIRL